MIKNLSKAVEPKIKQITGSDRRTLPILYEYERTSLIGHRCNQLMQGAKPILQDTAGLSSLEIAEKELQLGILPLLVCRKMPDVSEEEVWTLSELSRELQIK